MFAFIFILLAAVSLSPRFIHAHIALWHPSMWGFNATDKTYPYDNRPVVPLTDMTFDQWWFHGHLDHPPHPEDFFELPAGGAATAELACNKGATSFFASSEGGNIQNGNDPCPGSPMSEWHTTGINDLFGCALGITYKSDVNEVQPEDFTVFSVNQTCVWTRFTDFQVPAKMPPCPEGGCICAWFWIHSPDSGGEQNYMNGFKCNVTGSMSNVALATPQVPRRCGADPANDKMQAAPGNCTYGAKQPFYWFQKERNNMFEGTYAPPRYLDMYNFKNGAQDDIFADSYPSGLPPPGPNSTFVPTPFLGAAIPAATADSTSLPPASASSTLLSSPSVFGSALPTSSVPVSSGNSVSTESASAAISITSSLDSSTPTVSISVSVSTAIVISTAVVTVTQAPPSSSPSPTSTVTLVNTLVSFVTETVVASPEVALPSSPAGPGTTTVIVFASPSPSSTINAALAPTDRILEADAISLSSSSTASLVSLPTESVGLRMCKRNASPSETPLQRRALSSYFSLPGVRRHRKMQKRSDVFNILF